jgi:hypothetical protein
MNPARFIVDAIRSSKKISSRHKRNTCRSGSYPRFRSLILPLLLLLVSQPLWAKVTATLTQNSIYDGDTVTLIIESTDRDHTGEPDLMALQQSFEILGTRNSQQTQIINGRRTDKRQWHIELVPKGSGTVTVPAITVGNDTTEVLQLTVKPQSAAVAAGTGESVFVKALIEPVDASVYVQQQIHYILKLFYRESLSEGAFSNLDMKDVLIERLGDDKSYSTTINGERYQVLERRYAIFPEQSGELIIPAVVFNGRMAGEPLRRGRTTGMGSMMDRFFGEGVMRASGKRIRLRSDAIRLNIKPRPADYSGEHWLPSEQLVLGDSWVDGPPEFRTGEPVTRTITLEAKGLESSHFPEINLPGTAGVRVYPEKPEHETRTDGEWVYGISKQKIAYVAVAAGRITLPEMRLDWWDTTTQQQRSAVIPAWEINVLAGEGGTPDTLLPAVNASETTEAPEVADTATAYPVKTVLAVLILSVLIMAGFVWRRRAGQVGAAAAAAVSIKHQLAASKDALEKACQRNDPQAAVRALLQWAEARWPDDPPRNLGVLARRLASGKEEIRSLERALYGVNPDGWQGNPLWKAFEHGFEVIPDEKQVIQEGLSPLYPY